jgi:hypothetical protein
MAAVANIDLLPVYVNMGMIQKYVAPLTRKKLREWTIKGWVRTSKLGTEKQAQRLFNVNDILDVLDRAAKGLMPRIKSR